MMPTLMEPSTLRLGRAVVGGIVFVTVATIMFEGVGQSSPRPALLPSNAYRAVAIDDGDVTSALNFALADQKKKNRSDNAVALRKVLSAERQASKGDNFRLCLSLSRRGRADTARTVVHRNQKRQWSVALWAWGACGKSKN